MDINLRKPRVINLRKKKIKQFSAPIKIRINNPIVSEKPIERLWEGGEFPCIQCGVKEAIELGRCRVCDSEHQKIVDRLDAAPKQVLERVQPRYETRKEVSSGVVVTVTRTEPLKM